MEKDELRKEICIIYICVYDLLDIVDDLYYKNELNHILIRLSTVIKNLSEKK